MNLHPLRRRQYNTNQTEDMYIQYVFIIGAMMRLDTSRMLRNQYVGQF